MRPKNALYRMGTGTTPLQDSNPSTNPSGKQGVSDQAAQNASHLRLRGTVNRT